MPFSRPTLSQLLSQVAQDIAAAVPGADALLRFTNLGVLSSIQAMLANLHFGYLDWIAKQSIPVTATAEYMEGWAGLVGVTRKPATPASGSVSFTGTAGTTIPAGTAMTRGDGASFTTIADAVIGSGGSVTVTALADTPGAAGNAVAGTLMTLTAALGGVQSQGAAATAFTGGADLETDDALRSRMLERYQAPPQGGAQIDYVTWALAVPGVTRAWVGPGGAGPGTVVVYMMMDVAEAAFNGFPQGGNGVASSEPRAAPASGDQLAVANYLYPLQPVTALVYVCAPNAHAVAFTMKGIAAGQRAAAVAAIADIFLREGAPGGSVMLAHVWGAIAAVTGVNDFVIQTPSADIASPAGSLPTVGAIAWI